MISNILKQAYKYILNKELDKYQDDMLVIIMYHGICDYYRPNAITPWDFEAGLSELVKAGFKSYSFGELIRDKFEFKGRKFIVTFDDAEKGVIKYGLPILIKHHIKGCVFVSPALLSKSYGFSWTKLPKSIVALGEIKKHQGYRIEHMNMDDIVKWINEGLEIGSHGLQHLDLSALCLNPGLLKLEVEQSKLMLENNFPVTIETFAYPFGSYNQVVKECVKEHYKCAVTVIRGGLSRKAPTVDAWELPRITGANAFGFTYSITKLIESKSMKGVITE